MLATSKTLLKLVYDSAPSQSTAEVLIAVKSNEYLGDGDDNEEDDDVMKVIGNLDVKKIIATAGMYVYTLFERCVVMTFLFSIRVKL